MTLGNIGPALAQGMEHKVGGKVVPAAQIEAVQAKCDELRVARLQPPILAQGHAATTSKLVSLPRSTSNTARLSLCSAFNAAAAS